MTVVTDLAPPEPSVVISVVYDGPARAGKTTSVRALARSFGREVYTPEERDGRTVYFDWLEHVGGRFDGAPIRCQIASVPGQKRWTRRRGHFLERADVVVFVGDTTAAAWPETAARLAELRAELDARTGAPVGLVFQANKRDRPDALALVEIQAAAAHARTAIVESIANDGSGVREAFVLAVRLALDRVRAEHDHHGAARGATRGGFGEHGPALVEHLRTFDSELLPFEPSGTAPTTNDTTDTTASIDAAIAAPRPPSLDTPSGFVWPPIEGRILLREAAPPAGAPVHVTATGECVSGDGTPWRASSNATAVFGELDDARAVLVAWARQHAAAHAILSRRRCIVLAETGDGRWRLWQIVQREPTLRQLAGTLGDATTQRLIGDATATCAGAALPLACTADTLGIADTMRPIYIGAMPFPHAEAR